MVKISEYTIIINANQLIYFFNVFSDPSIPINGPFDFSKVCITKCWLVFLR